MHPVPPVLDLGSGLGFFLEFCLRHGTKVVGIELSREGTKASAARGLPVVRADLTIPLPFRDGSFGSALAHHVLEHVPLEKERLILREVHRVLRPGGFVFVISPNIHQPDARDDPDHINLFAPRELAAEARRAGYSHVDLGTNFWRKFWEPALPLGHLGTLISGALWKMAPIDRFAGSASVIAWK
jgi:SAM-dependent methyltransferase